MTSRILFIVSIVSLAFMATACPSGGGGNSDSALVAATQLTSSAEAHWNGIMGTFDSVDANLARLSEMPNNIAGAAFDIDAVSSMMEECFKAPIQVVEKAGDAAAEGDGNAAMKYGQASYDEVANCGPNMLDSVDNYKAGASAEVGAFVEQKLAAIDELRKDLVYNLPERIAATPDLVADWTGLMAEVLADAEAAFQTASNNPLASQEEIAAAQGEYDAVVNEMSKLEGLLGTMGSDVADMPTRILGLMNTIEADLGSFAKKFSDMGGS